MKAFFILLFLIAVSFGAIQSFTLSQYLNQVYQHNLTLQQIEKNIAINHANWEYEKNLMVAPNLFTKYDFKEDLTEEKARNIDFSSIVNWSPLLSIGTHFKFGLKGNSAVNFSDLFANGPSNVSFSDTRNSNLWTTSFTLGIKQPLLRDGFVGNKKSRINLLKQQTDIAKFQYQESIQSTLKNALLLFIQYDLNQQQLKRAQQNLKDNQAIHQFNLKKFKKGLLNKTIIHESNIAVLESQQIFNDQQQATLQTKLKLLELANLPVSSHALFKPSFQKPTLDSLNLNKLLATTLQKNASLKVTQKSHDISKHQFKLAQKDIWPLLDLNLDLDYSNQNKNFANSLTGGRSIDYKVGFEFRVLLKGLTLITKKAQHQHQQTSIALIRKKAELKSTLQEQIHQLKTQYSNYKHKKQILTLNQKRHALIKTHYTQGRINFNEYLLSGQKLRQAETQYFVSLFNYRLSNIELKTTTGSFLSSYIPNSN